MNIKIKINSSICAGLALASLFLNTAGAQDLTPKLGNVGIVSVDRMSLTNTGTAYMVSVAITFQNLNTESFKFRNADLQVMLKTDRPDGTSELVDLGPSHLSEVVVPGGSTNVPGTTNATANIVLGSTNEATNVKLVQLFNAIGDPSNKVALLLNGSSELGLQVPHGWLYNGRFDVELSFTPSIQHKVLIN